MIWLPTFITGLRAVIGSWKTIAISVPHSSRYPSELNSEMSRPSNVTRPERSAVEGSRPMIERDSTDLPDPDSPTIPRH